MQYLFDYIRQAIEGTDTQKKWLRDASNFFRCQKKEETRALGVLFNEILDNPTRFSIPPEPYHKKAGIDKKRK